MTPVSDSQTTPQPLIWAIFDGTGSYRVGEVLLKPGATPIYDPAIVALLQRERIPWITLSETREIPPEDADPPIEITPIVYDKFRGRDEKWYFHYPVGEGSNGVVQSKAYETEDEVDAAIIEARDGKTPDVVPTADEVESPESPLSGTLTSSDARRTQWVCQKEGCDHAPFSSENARTNHERIKHPELFGGQERPKVPAAPLPPPGPPPAPRPATDPETAGVPNPNPPEEAVPATTPGETGGAPHKEDVV